MTFTKTSEILTTEYRLVFKLQWIKR